MGKKSALIEDMSVCMVCGRPHPHAHHIFFGPKKAFCDRYGYLIPLCYEHHEGMQGPHRNREIDIAYKRMAQRHYEAHIGTREDFIRELGKSYILD